MRPELLPNHPVHVVLRMQCYIAELRTRRLYHVIRKVLGCYLTWPDFRIVHISIQNEHLHLIVEADNRDALTRGMQSFAISCAKSINRDRGGRGKVFAYRYHATQITTPRQARNTLAYVLNNWRRHKLDFNRNGFIEFPYDPYSSALTFAGWTKRHDVCMPCRLETAAGITAEDLAVEVGLQARRLGRSVRVSGPDVVTTLGSYKCRAARRLARLTSPGAHFVAPWGMSDWRTGAVVVMCLLVACSSPAPALGGLEGRYEGTLTISYQGNSKTLGMTMTFEADGRVVANSELDQPQHNYFHLRPDRTAIDLYNQDNRLFGHIQLTELTPDRIKGVMLPDNGTRDLGTTNTIDMVRVPPGNAVNVR